MSTPSFYSSVSRCIAYAATLSACLGDPALGNPASPTASTPDGQEASTVAGLMQGKAVLETWPSHGTAGVPTNLAFVALRLADMGIPLSGFALEQAEQPVGSSIEDTDCTALGWPAGTCALLRPQTTLQPLSTYRVTHRAADSLWQSELRTAAGPQTEAPGLIQSECALDEQATPAGCALLEDQRIFLRVEGDQPLRLTLQAEHAGASATTRALASRAGETWLALPALPPATTQSLTLTLHDLANLQRSWSFSLTTAQRLATLSITEVRADPRGPEPAQEYVEVLNFGDQPVSMRGMQLSTDPQALGDIMQRSTPVPAGGRALIVSPNFDANDARDEPPPAGTLLLRLASALGNGGLSNQGQVLLLRDANGRRLSAAPAQPMPRAGVCLARRLPELRRGLPEDFGYDAAQGCTPGLPDRLPEP